jgi:membrane-associated phospholipid phosphatase
MLQLIYITEMVVLPQWNEFRKWIGVPPPKKESGAVTELRERFSNYHYHIVEHDPDNFRIFIAFLIVYIIILLVQPTRYYWWYPSFNLSMPGVGKAFPNSHGEVNVIINEYIMKRMPSDIAFFRLTDMNVSEAFTSIIKSDEMTVEEMDHIVTSSRVVFVTKIMKWKYNRARPAQIAPEVINERNGTLLHSVSAATPSYPSGHAVQAYYLAKILARRFPAKTQAVMEIATKCANIRIMAGLHYPSDRDFAWWIVDKYLTDK